MLEQLLLPTFANDIFVTLIDTSKLAIAAQTESFQNSINNICYCAGGASSADIILLYFCMFMLPSVVDIDYSTFADYLQGRYCHTFKATSNTIERALQLSLDSALDFGIQDLQDIFIGVTCYLAEVPNIKAAASLPYKLVRDIFFNPFNKLIVATNSVNIEDIIGVRGHILFEVIPSKTMDDTDSVTVTLFISKGAIKTNSMVVLMIRWAAYFSYDKIGATGVEINGINP